MHFMQNAAETDAETVWHYTSAQGLKCIITENVLWASSAAFMNDTREAQAGTDNLYELWESRKTSLAEDERLEVEKHLPPREASRNELFILSTSTLGDSLSNWRAYGKDSVPFAIGLDPKILLLPVEIRTGVQHPSPPENFYEQYHEEDEDGVPFYIGSPDDAMTKYQQWKNVVYDSASERQDFESHLDYIIEKSIEVIQRMRTDGRRGGVPIWLYGPSQMC